MVSNPNGVEAHDEIGGERRRTQPRCGW